MTRERIKISQSDTKQNSPQPVFDQEWVAAASAGRGHSWERGGSSRWSGAGPSDAGVGGNICKLASHGYIAPEIIKMKMKFCIF